MSRIETKETNTEVTVVEQLPNYAILNPEVPMSSKVKVATKVADTLAPLVREQGLAIKGLNKKNPEAEYVMVEGWEILGTILGIVPVTTIIRDIKNKHEHTVGYRARATLYRNPIIKNDEIVGGTVIARAEAQADKSGWQNDMFAIASMAQTRALGKAYRMGLSWIMKMAGFEGTPAEEMPKYSEENIREAEIRFEEKKAKAKTPEPEVVDVDVEVVEEPKMNTFDSAKEIAKSIVDELPQRNILFAKLKLKELLEQHIVTEDECQDIVAEIERLLQ